MVYCGKPSKACRRCRNRNIKCDKKRASCGQCLRVKLSCPGYHDPESLQFRHQTNITIQKVFISCHPNSNLPRIAPSIPISTEDHAKRLFVSRQVFGSGFRSGEQKPSDVTFYYMRAFNPFAIEDVHALSGFRAASLAYLANEASSPQILDKARKYYSSALCQTNKALQTPKTAKQNVTLLTVLLLDHFESLTKKYSLSELGSVHASEARHLQGAIALVKLRGNGQFKDPLSLCLFHHLSWRVLEGYLKGNAELPEDFKTLHVEAAKFVGKYDLEWDLERLIIRFCDLKSGKFKAGTLDRCLMELQQDCKALEERITLGMRDSDFSSDSELFLEYKRATVQENSHLIREAVDELCQNMLTGYGVARSQPIYTGLYSPPEN